MSEDSVHDLLQTLAEADASAEAGPEIELRLRKKFRSWKRRRAWRHAAVWAPVAAAMIVLIFALANRKLPSAPVNEEVMTHDTVERNQSGIAVFEASPPVTLKTPARVQKRAASSQQSKPAEIVTEFFPLMDPAPPLGRGQLFRVELPASAMQMVGLPVHEEHLSDAVQADVLVGEEGLPRAIRFVKFAMK